MVNLEWPEMLKPYSGLIIGCATALLIFIVGWVLSKWTHLGLCRVLGNRGVDAALTGFLASLARYFVFAAAVIVALEKVGVETTSLVALLASAGLAVGLALQGSLSNLAAGVMLMMFRPFTLGDKVTAAGHTGKAEDIGLFATTFLTPDNEVIIVPNAAITSGSITNHTSRGTLRGNIQVGVAYGTDLGKAMEVMEAATRRSALVLAEPAPAVYFNGFGASSLDFVVRPWGATGDLFPMLQNVRLALYDDLNAAGIDIPFDQIVVHQAA